MTLKKYLKLKKKSIWRFSGEIGESPQRVGNYVRRKVQPNIDIALKIVAATGGEVTLEDLCRR